MRKIFIDCGAYDGCSVRMFLDEPNAEQLIFINMESMEAALLSKSNQITIIKKQKPDHTCFPNLKKSQ